MPSPFLSDDTWWLLFCAARLAELDAEGRDAKHHEVVAKQLHGDPHFRALAATAAAEAYLATVGQQAA